MKGHIHVGDINETTPLSRTLKYTIHCQTDIVGLGDRKKHLVFEDHLCRNTPFDQAGSKFLGNECMQMSGKLSSGPMEESQSVISHCDLDMLEISEDSCSIPENGDSDGFTPEIQQAYRIFQSFLLEKHKAVTAPVWFPVGNQAGNDMCLKKMDEKFVKREYESITEFVADFRQMLENCYRFHGVDHWISKQAQKLEIILEQKLTLLSRTLREKTALAVTSRGRFGTEDEKAPVGISTRRRSVPRNLAAISAGGSESVMVQALRLEEQQRAKEEKRQRDLEKREAGEASAKEVEEWEHSLLSLAEPWPIGTMWELPAIGHFLCLAQTALNLPEIVFFELERCLLMPRCSSFLAKIMTSLLCPPHRRMTLHRRPALPYRRWEVELRRKVLGWYQSIGRAKDQEACAEHLGLCHRFFWTLGETSPLEEKPFHLLPFNQRVWLLKGLCDNVYETQKDVQDAVLGQPIHECRESILGYDSQENTYIHFPHFCGADLRIYCQSPCLPLDYPLPSFSVKKLEPEVVDRTEENLSLCPDVKAGNLEFCLRDQDDGSEESDVDWKGLDKFQFSCKEEMTSPESVMEKHLEVKKNLELKEEDTKDAGYEPCLRVGKNCYTGKFPANSLSANALESSLPSEIGGTVKKGSSCQNRHPCPKCSIDSHTDQELHSCLCFTPESDWNASVSFQQTSHSRAEMKIQSQKKRRKKKKEKLLGIKVRTDKPGLKKLRQARMTKSSMYKAAADLRKDKRKIQKLGRKFVPKKTQEKNMDHPLQLPVEPKFKLVCTSLDELRELISKTEDELDELESTKKRCERWFIKREAVKELHITLIRLLNELLPWEPKLLKAFHRNRARLKKESDDFKKHPEYENFVREEWVAFEVDVEAYKEVSSSTDISRELKDEDKPDRLLMGGSGTTDYQNHIGVHSLAQLVGLPDINTALSESGPLTRSSKRSQSGGLDEDFALSKKGKMVADDSMTPEAQTKVTSRDQSTAGANSSTTETSSVVTAPLGYFQRRCNPIQALLAKSVGNKVTLTSHPQVAVTDPIPHCPNKTTASPRAVCHPTPQSTPVSLQRHTSSSSPVQKPIQVVYKASEGLGLVKNNVTPVTFSVQPVIHQKTGEKAMQQVFLLPTNLLVQKTDEKGPQNPSSISAVATSKPPTVFNVPENKIPVQQVSPLKSISSVMTSSTVSPSLQKSMSCGVSPTCKKTAESSSTLKGSTTSTSATTDSSKCELNQELKTVCIRDSQSILVTTRGGNTGVVKVQTSDNSGASILPSSPIFTLPPKYQAFLVSKASTVSTSTPQMNTTSKLLPIVSTLMDKDISFNLNPQSPLKCDSLVNPSPLMGRLSGTVSFNNDLPFPVGSFSDSTAKGAQVLLGINSLVPAISQSCAGVPTSGWAIQAAGSENIIRLTQNKPHDAGIDPVQSTFQKGFVVTSTTDMSVSSITTTSASSAFPGSRVKFMSQSGSTCSMVTVAKELVASEPSITFTTTSSAAKVMKGRPNLGQAIISTSAETPTEVQGINIPGLAARILERNITMENKPQTTAETTTNVAPMSNVLATSSGQIFVHNVNSATTNCSSLNVNGPINVAGSVYSKSVKFSTYDSGHMVSSEHLSAVQQKSVSHSVSTAPSVSGILKNRSELVVSSSAPNISCSVLGTPFNIGTTLTSGVTQDGPLGSSSLSMASTAVKLPIVNCMTRVSQPLSLSTTTAKHVSDNAFPAAQSVMASTVRSHISAIPGTTVQDKVVINTTVPLAPGAHLLINNTRFVVPPQGLAPGSHVLLITSPTVHPTGQQGTSPIHPAPRVAATLTPPLVASVVQGPRMVTPGIRSQDTTVRQPTPIKTKTEQSVSINDVLTAASPPTIAKMSQLGTAQSSGQQGLTHIVRIPSFLLPEVKEYSAASSPTVTSSTQESVTVSAQSQRFLPNMTTPKLLQTEPANVDPRLNSDVTAVKTVISWPAPVVKVSPLSSTVSRMQTLPVATVPPIGSTVNSSQTTCVATVSPSINTLLMSTCQPVRPVQPGNVRMIVTSHPPQVDSMTPVQISGGQTIGTPRKLLLSPDGAILNVLRCPSQQNLPVMTDKTTIGVTTSNAHVLRMLDLDRKVTSGNPE